MADSSAFKWTRCGQCGRPIHTRDTDCERLSIPLRFLLYPIPLLSYLFMAHMVKHFCCLSCKERYEANHPNAWKSTFWWLHGTLFLIFGVPVLYATCLTVTGNTDSFNEALEQPNATKRVEQTDFVNKANR